MDILQKQTGKVLGPQGSTIKEMQSRLGVKLNIQVSDSAKSGEDGAINKLKMTGTVDAVRSAKLCVNHILGGGSLETYNFPVPMGGNHMIQGVNNFMSQQMNQQQQQFSYSKPPVPTFNGQQSYYPVALTSTGYGQNAPMNHNQSSNFGGSMPQNPAPHYGSQNTTPTYGAPMAQSPTPSYRPQPAPAMTAPTSQGASLGLGADGTSGVLEPPSTQADGSHQQIANVRSDVLGKIIGKAGVNITLIKTKSGASVHVVKTAVPDPSGYTKVMMAGAAADVYLATQMIQEVSTTILTENQSSYNFR